MVEMVTMVAMAYQAQLAGMAKMERLERWGSLASEAHLAQAVEGWSTLAGDEQPALTHQEQSWSMQEGQEEPSIMYKEEQPTTSACQKTQTIYGIHLECRIASVTVKSVGLSMTQIEVL